MESDGVPARECPNRECRRKKKIEAVGKDKRKERQRSALLSSQAPCWLSTPSSWYPSHIPSIILGERCLLNQLWIARSYDSASSQLSSYQDCTNYLQCVIRCCPWRIHQLRQSLPIIGYDSRRQWWDCCPWRIACWCRSEPNSPTTPQMTTLFLGGVLVPLKSCPQ